MKGTLNVLLAGFGGQGVLFAGKVVAYAGLVDNKEVSWLPSYGPEMRGGTANCSVCLSDQAIGSPLVLEPDALIVMNRPSLDKFIDSVAVGGTVIIDSTIIDKKVERTDIKVCYVDATKLAEDNDCKGLTNMILIGKLFKETAFCSEDALDKAIHKSVPPRKAALIEANKRAIGLGIAN